MKSILSIALPAMLLMSGAAFAQGMPTSPSNSTQQPSGGSADQQMSAGTAGLQGAVTGEAGMNGPAGDGSAGNGRGDAAIATNHSHATVANENSERGGHLNGVAGDNSGMGMGKKSMRASRTNDTSGMSASNQTSSSMSGSMDSPTYQGGRKGYHGKSTRALDASEAQETAQLNQQYGVTNR